MKELISAYPVVIELPIAWGDMDAFQHVNNIVYFKHFESARISYFEKIDFLEIMNKTGIGPILASTQCRYKIPLTYPDHITVGAKVASIEKDRFIMKYAVISLKHKKIAASGEGVIVTFDYQNNKKALVPDGIKKESSTLKKAWARTFKHSNLIGKIKGRHLNGSKMTPSNTILTERQLDTLMQREVDRYEIRTPKSKGVFTQARDVLLNGVPMPWMGDWGTAYPLFIDRASGNRIIDVDGNEYVDFCLGDTGAMFGHSPKATADAVTRQVRLGITTMLPSKDAVWVGKALRDRFGLACWQVAMTATEANRYVIRICRTLTRRPKILVFNECYHGSIDEALVHIGPSGNLVLRSEYDINPGVPKEALTRVVEFNDVEALEGALSHKDVACVLAEPVMTNCGMVLPAPGYHKKLRELCSRYGTYLVIDETHTLSSGPGGYTAAHGLDPDFLTFGKAIAGGIPVAVYGFTAEIADRINAAFGTRGLSDPMGIGGTLSGNAFAVNAMRATLAHVATPEAFALMIDGANRMADGLEAAIQKYGLPWSVTRCGARAELQFMPRMPTTGKEAKASFRWDLIYYTHLYLANRGLLITPFHNMMLVPPMATNEDIDLLVDGWDACMGEISALTGKG